MQEYYWLILVSGLIISPAIGFWFFLKHRKTKLVKSDVVFYQQMWKKVLQEQYSQPGRAVLDADNLVDKVMASLGYSGSLGAKLKKYRSVFSDINGIWMAHKLRNRIAHELNFSPSGKDADMAIKQFRKALNDLGLIV